MKKLILKVFETVIKTEEESIKTEACIDEEVFRLIEPFEEILDGKEMEMLKDALFSVAITGEETGFQLGVKTTIRLLLELFAEK